MRIFKRKPKVVEVPPIAQESIAGFKFRVFTEPAQLPFKRAIKYLGLKEQAYWRMNEGTVNVFLENLTDYIKADKKEEALTLINYVNELRKMENTIAEVLEFIDCFILVPGEKENELSLGYKQMKIELSKNPEILDFFLAFAQPLLKKPTDSSTDIINYLKESGRIKMENRLLGFITRPAMLTLGKV